MNEIGEFLRARRARLRPADVGLTEYGPRRVPGLRREELAALAGLGVDYYRRLEQGRLTTVSDSVLGAVADALRLDEAERGYLRNLVRPVRRYGARQQPHQRVRPAVQRLLDMMVDVPAFVLGRALEVLAWNALGDAVMGFTTVPAKYRDLGRLTFRHPDAHTFYRDWPAVAAEVVGHLRLDAARHSNDARMQLTVAALTTRGSIFRSLWEREDVRERAHGPRLLRHPIAGDLDLEYEMAPLPGDDQTLVVFTAAAGSPSDERLRLLASWEAEAPSRTDR